VDRLGMLRPAGMAKNRGDPVPALDLPAHFKV
jgi:hypothetical protein